MSLILYKSNRLEILAHHLAEQSLRPPLSSPFVAEQVLVQTQGMAQWLKLELSKRRGIVANVEFPFPRAFLSRLIRDLLPEHARTGAIDPEALTWRVMGRIEALLPQPAFSDIKDYLASSPDPRRKFQLAERVAALFDQYSIYRPEWIAAWQKGEETHWQAHLWRVVMTDGLAYQGKFLHELIQALQNPGCEKSRLPERLSIFAPNNLPPIYLAVFAALASHIPVHLFCLCPCRDYWGDTPTPGEAERIQAFTGDGNFNPEDLHLEGANPLLAAWGRTGRAFQRLVRDLEGIEREVEDYYEPENGHLLGSTQSSILLLEEEAFKDREKVEVKRDDRSIQVHACHSPLHCNSPSCSQAAMSFSCRQRDEFIDIRLARCQEGRENTAPLGGDLPAVGVGNLGDEAVGVQQGQPARDLGGLEAFLFLVLGLAKEQRSNVAVAKALDAFCSCTERTNPLTAKEIAPFLYFTPMATTSL